MCKWEQYFDDLPVHTIQKQLYFRLAFEPATLDGYPGHFTEDISETLEKKLESVKCYATQFPESKGYVFDRVRAAAVVAGTAAGFSAGEVFVAPKPLGSDDLMKTMMLTS